MTGLEAVADAEDAVRRIAMLEARNPDIMIWPPDDSVSGEWEALGDGWLIQEKSPARFREHLKFRGLAAVDDRGLGGAGAAGATYFRHAI